MDQDWRNVSQKWFLSECTVSDIPDKYFCSLRQTRGAVIVERLRRSDCFLNLKPRSPGNGRQHLYWRRFLRHLHKVLKCRFIHFFARKMNKKEDLFNAFHFTNTKKGDIVWLITVIKTANTRTYCYEISVDTIQSTV